MSTADSALDRARHAQEELRRAAGDVAQLSHKVRGTWGLVGMAGMAVPPSPWGWC